MTDHDVMPGSRQAEELRWEQCLRLRAAWAACGWRWPLDDDVLPPHSSDQSFSTDDLKSCVALLVAHHGATVPRPASTFAGIVLRTGEVVLSLDPIRPCGIVETRDRWDGVQHLMKVPHLESLPRVLATYTSGDYFIDPDRRQG